MWFFQYCNVCKRIHFNLLLVSFGLGQCQTNAIFISNNATCYLVLGSQHLICTHFSIITSVKISLSFSNKAAFLVQHHV